MMRPDGPFSFVLLLLGLGFLVANLRAAVDLARFLRLRSRTLLVWPAPKPPYYGMLIAIGIALGGLLAYNLLLGRAVPAVIFGESMMFLYYAGAVPLGRRIPRGFYADGIWAERGFVRYARIDGISWRGSAPGGEYVTLLLISRVRSFARRLIVPVAIYGAARRLLRDRIKADEIRFKEPVLDLGGHDETDDV